MKRGQKRLLVVPAHLSQRTQAPYPQQEGTQLYAVLLDRVKRNPNKAAGGSARGRNEDMMPLPDIGDVPERKTRRQSTVTPTRKQARPTEVYIEDEEEDYKPVRQQQEPQQVQQQQPQQQYQPQQPQQPNYAQPQQQSNYMQPYPGSQAIVPVQPQQPGPGKFNIASQTYL